MSDMTDMTDLRTELIGSLRASREAERAIFGALDPAIRDAPGPDGGWSPKDNLAHLSAWRQRQVTKMAAYREGQPEPAAPAEGLDAINEVFHAERARWSWDRVDQDADATTDAFIAEIAAATDDALTDEKILRPILGDGAEHDLGHLGPIAASVGMSDRVNALAEWTMASIESGVWPERVTAFARYNLACYAALAGDLEKARGLLRQALPGQAELLELAPKDDDLIALRDEIPALAAGT